MTVNYSESTAEFVNQLATLQAIRDWYADRHMKAIREHGAESDEAQAEWEAGERALRAEMEYARALGDRMREQNLESAESSTHIATWSLSKRWPVVRRK